MIKLISSSSASFSEPVTMYSKSRIWETRRVVLLLWTPVKYERTRFFRTFALPTYKIFPFSSFMM